RRPEVWQGTASRLSSIRPSQEWRRDRSCWRSRAVRRPPLTSLHIPPTTLLPAEPSPLSFPISSLQAPSIRYKLLPDARVCSRQETVLLASPRGVAGRRPSPSWSSKPALSHPCRAETPRQSPTATVGWH